MSAKRGLGKGLDALLMGTKTPTEPSLTAEPIQQPTQGGLLELSITSLVPGRYQPRREMQANELEALAESIRAQGIIQPLIVRPFEKNTYEIIAGERRWRAAQLAGLEKVPVVVKNVGDEAAMVMALIENIQRADLNPLEEALAFDRLAKEFGLTHIQVAEAVGKSRTVITNSLRLLTLSDDVKLYLEQREIEVGHAKVLLGLRGHLQSKIARLVVQKGLSVRETERLVGQAAEGSSEGNSTKRFVDPDIRQLQQNLSDKLGARLEIAHSQQGKGKIVIHYNNLDELDGILGHIN